MISPFSSAKIPSNSIAFTNQKTPLLYFRPVHLSHQHYPREPRKTHLIKPIRVSREEVVPSKSSEKKKVYGERTQFSQVGSKQMSVLCGLGYWVQGFRCFPWLALNFHMAYNLNLNPSILQLVQNTGNLPMVAKPLYGILSDALYIGGSHRVPYITIGVLLQVLSWGSLALVPIAREALLPLILCIILGNLGASITEVANDALITEYGKKHKINGLQSYAFMALAAGGVLGNLLGGFYLLRTQKPDKMFSLFSLLLSLQLLTSLRTRESSLGLPEKTDSILISQSIKKQFSDLLIAIKEETISRPLIWVMGSLAIVPILSGSVFCYQTQCLNLNSSIIGMSKVVGQLMLLSLTLLYNRFWKKIPLRKLTGAFQVVYALSLLLDFILVKQINLQLGISNETFVLCFSALAETIAQFKLLPFAVLLASLCPPGCEGSLTSFAASALCLSAVVSGFLGVGLASLIGIKAGDFSSLPLGIIIQFLAALLPLGWLNYIPVTQMPVVKERKGGRSKRSRKYRRIGRVMLDSVFSYRRKRESEAKR